MKHTLKILFAFLALSIVSCSSDNEPENPSSSSCEFDIPFVAEGNLWTVNVTTFGSSTVQITNEIIGCEEGGLKVEITGPDGSITNFWKQEDGYLWTDANNAENGFNRFYKKDASVGETFSYTRNDGTFVTREVIAIDSMITVPAGTFVCDVYKRTATNIINENIIMWNHEVGQIKSDSGFSVSELASYNFN